ncbi:hypothetical protein [Shewanella sp. NIFS-20-20]|uniref:hypothetical protein n=1 Tax=Shewanella sp. NIFS-20-20 TaxID=2853806 RepID=UPI001C441E05|nr:hypothetical protein [Shewanella sp. NIFS-20-20]MBV7317058.1 hypothetical protein [Shewanella sp. NIFS-20-20]
MSAINVKSMLVAALLSQSAVAMAAYADDNQHLMNELSHSMAQAQVEMVQEVTASLMVVDSDSELLVVNNNVESELAASMKQAQEQLVHDVTLSLGLLNPEVQTAKEQQQLIDASVATDAPNYRIHRANP